MSSTGEILDHEGYFTSVGSEAYWRHFDVSYKDLHTIILLKLLSRLRSDYSKYGEHISGFQKRIDGLKRALTTRKHMPNKLGRALIRKQKAKRK